MVMRITVDRNFVATIVVAVILSSGCASQSSQGEDAKFPEFAAPATWSWGTPDRSANPTARTEKEAANAVTSSETANRGATTSGPAAPSLVPAKLTPQTIVVGSREADLAALDARPEVPSTRRYTQAKAAETSAIEHTSVWTRIRAGFGLQSDHPEHLQEHISWIGSHERYFKRVTERGQPYLHYVLDEVEKRAMPTEIVLLPVIESGFKPFAYSSGKAAGIWQIIPSTGKQLGLKSSWWYDGRRDVIDSTGAALDYLQLVNNNLGGDWLLSLAAYNCGEGAVRRARRKARAAGKGQDFWSIRPYLPRETQAYVPRLLAAAAAVHNPSRFGLSLYPVANQAHFDVVKLPGQIDLGIAAKTAGITLKEMQRLNPGFKRWATDPDGPHRLLVPRHRTAVFRAALAKLPLGEQVVWRRHAIRSGETLGQIANRYGTKTDVLRRVNHLKSTTIRVGKDLLVPMPMPSSDGKAIARAKAPARKATAKQKSAGSRHKVR